MKDARGNNTNTHTHSHTHSQINGDQEQTTNRELRIAARCEVGGQQRREREKGCHRRAKQLNQIAAKWRTQLAKSSYPPAPPCDSFHVAQFRPLPGWLPLNGLWGKYFKCADFWHVLVAVHVLNCCHRHSPRPGTATGQTQEEEQGREQRERERGKGIHAQLVSLTI